MAQVMPKFRRMPIQVDARPLCGGSGKLETWHAFPVGPRSYHAWPGLSSQSDAVHFFVLVPRGQHFWVTVSVVMAYRADIDKMRRKDGINLRIAAAAWQEGVYATQGVA